MMIIGLILGAVFIIALIGVIYLDNSKPYTPPTNALNGNYYKGKRKSRGKSKTYKRKL